MVHMINEILNTVNSALEKINVNLINTNVKNEYIKVHNDFAYQLSKIKVPVKYLIIGEATRSYSNYFYKLDSPITSFLYPKHFLLTNNKKNSELKETLLDYFIENQILVFDLYPLPLPTFIYDNVSFDCEDQDYKTSLKEYFKTIERYVDKDTIVVLRYKKLIERCEWLCFQHYFSDKVKFISVTEFIKKKGKELEVVVPLNISGKGEAPDKTKINDIFIEKKYEKQKRTH